MPDEIETISRTDQVFRASDGVETRSIHGEADVWGAKMSSDLLVELVSLILLA
jgi:hypothetical protein